MGALDTLEIIRSERGARATARGATRATRGIPRITRATARGTTRATRGARATARGAPRATRGSPRAPEVPPELPGGTWGGVADREESGQEGISHYYHFQISIVSFI